MKLSRLFACANSRVVTIPAFGVWRIPVLCEVSQISISNLYFVKNYTVKLWGIDMRSSGTPALVGTFSF